MPYRFITALALTLVMVSPAISTQRFESGPKQVSLLELYTSEGCSSCPPADEWLSELESHPDLWQTLIPLAFHVDYWDRLGWPDRFADARFSSRQRDYAAHWGHRVVYTPGFVFNGAELRHWRRGLPRLPTQTAGHLVAEIDGDKITLRYDRGDSAKAHVALLGFDLKTPVEAGENLGRTLVHDFVVLAYGESVMVQTKDGWQTEITFPAVAEPSDKMAIAAWISQVESPGPVQAVGGMITP